MSGRYKTQMLPQYNSAVRELLKLLFHMNRYFQRLDFRAKALMESAAYNHRILYFHLNYPDVNYKVYQIEHMRAQERRIALEMANSDNDYEEEHWQGAGSILTHTILQSNDGNVYSHCPPPSADSEESEYNFELNISTIEDMELLEENRQLRMCLEDYQRGVEMIMHKVREQFEQKVLKEEFILKDLTDDNLWNIIGEQRRLKHEMSEIMHTAANTNESGYLSNLETICYLVKENKSLRELVSISKEFGTFAQPIRYNELNLVEVGTQTDIHFDFPGFEMDWECDYESELGSEVEAEELSVDKVSDELPFSSSQDSYDDCLSLSSNDSSSSSSSNVSVATVREVSCSPKQLNYEKAAVADDGVDAKCSGEPDFEHFGSDSAANLQLNAADCNASQA